MKRVKKISFVILTILIVLIFTFNLYNFICIKVLHKDLASINGYAMLEVVSGSMEPTIHVGDIIIINTKEKDYKEKDIITFRGKENDFITHRIISIDNDNITTQGDNNDTKDETIKFNDIVGKYVIKIGGAGKILASFKSPFTMAMIFIIGLLACILFSTDKDGNPILDKDELEYQEFLKNKDMISSKDTKKEEKEIRVLPKKNKDSKKTNSSKKALKEETKKISEVKTEKNKVETKTKKVSNKKSGDSKKEKKPGTKKKTLNNVEPKPTKKVNTSKKVSASKAETRKTTTSSRAKIKK